MDVVKALGELYQEKKRLDLAIGKLEARQRGQIRKGDSPQLQRGRKSMSVEERRAVSQRMADYWAARKARGCSEDQVDHNLESASEPEQDQDSSAA